MPSAAGQASRPWKHSTRRQSKRASDLTGKDAKTGMPLYEDDAVRTFEKSSSPISFGASYTVEVDQNALVIISRGPQGSGDGLISPWRSCPPIFSTA